MKNELTYRPLAVMFDLDDTIVSFEEASRYAWKKVCADYVDRNNVKFSAQEMKSVISDTAKEYWSDPIRHKKGRENIIVARREIMDKAMSLLGETNKNEILRTADQYSTLQEEKQCLFDGAYEALQMLKTAGMKMAVITNGNSVGQRKKIERFNLEQFFDDILIDTEIGFSKPDERIFTLALNRLGVTANQAVMVGDNPNWDTIVPQQMGIFAVWNNYNNISPQEEVKADLTVHNIAELAQYVLDLPKRN